MTKNKKIEFKAIQISIESFDKIKGIFKGYASVFGELDKVNDTINPVAFDNSIAAFNSKESKVHVNFDHFDEIMIADNMMSMTTDETGLLVEFKVSDEAKKLYSELYSEMIGDTGSGKLFMSIGGWVVESSLGEDRWLKKELVNANDEIMEFELDHVAVTKHPIDTNARMLTVKSKRPVNVEEIDGEVSAIKFLSTNKSEMSNTSAKNFVLHLKNMWKKDLDTTKTEDTNKIEIPCKEPLGEEVSEDGDKKEAIDFKSIAKHL